MYERPPGSTNQAALCLELAEGAATWLKQMAVHQGDVVWWPRFEARETPPNGTLYNGVPGPVLFFLEYHRLTGDAGARELAEKGTRWLMQHARVTENGYTWPAPGSEEDQNGAVPGLYTGSAGVGATFLALHRQLGDSVYREYAQGAAEELAASSQDGDGGQSWGAGNDIISGAAGIGLFLVAAAQRLEQPAYLEAATQLGHALIRRAIADPPGLKWRMQADWPQLYPNFSHGTAGIAFFLARLHGLTGETALYKGAIAGAEWLTGHVETGGPGCAWYHHEPDRRDLYYVGWCHGPAGTARLFYQLYRNTGEVVWSDWAERCARWLMDTGVPIQPHPGFWNVSACCGTAGVGDFFADMYRWRRDAACWTWAWRMVLHLQQSASETPSGLKWVQAEHRTRPEEVYAQTGLAQGAAGIGLFLLKMYDLALNGDGAAPLALPDNPFE
jgi:lantibiotic modifying enzyme